ncbi:MAG: protein kinase [Oscillospiraceae bacterium]|nr:protein kinase [Oscillospiraceae bacterium]
MHIIANTYKIISQIGSGGGAIIYLAEHMRLGKKVVLKADKRTLSTGLKDLRREVDALKDLNHAYIPHVYDFIEDNGTVYTVMDYIDGESFDKPLRRGERFSQEQVIKWARQLLEALAYIHSRPPHGMLHADIKPSNVMLTPQGDARLIDFNIALVFGEEGAVAVGRSFGYASPEHYGLDFSSSKQTRETQTETGVVTEVSSIPASMIETVLGSTPRPRPSSSNGTPGKRSAMLNVRSDIYSLGATLYHIMTGERPAQIATDVKPMSAKDFSTAVINIISKAMNPNPNLRWQTAEEMLSAFENLREKDLRFKRHNRVAVIPVALLAALLLVCCFALFVGRIAMKQEQQQSAEEQDQLALQDSAYALAEYSANALRDGDTDAAIRYALQALSDSRIADAQKSLTDALGVYDLSDRFKPYSSVEMPSAPLYMAISPEGKTFAVLCDFEVAVVDSTTGKVIALLPVERSALSEVHYINEDTIIYSGNKELRVYNCTKGEIVWISRPATSIAVSADGKVAAAVYKDERNVTVYDTSNWLFLNYVELSWDNQNVATNDNFTNPNDKLFALNNDGTLLSTSFADGSLRICDLSDDGTVVNLFDSTSDFVRFEGGFCQHYFAFSATARDGSTFVIINPVLRDNLELFAYATGLTYTIPISINADESGIYIQNENTLIKMDPDTNEQAFIIEAFGDIKRYAWSEAYTLIAIENEYMFFDRYANLVSQYENKYSVDFVQIAGGSAIIGSRDSPEIRILKHESHADAGIFDYDPSYLHDEARLSADGKTVMLFSFRGFRLFGIGGEIIANVSMPYAGEVHDQQYCRDENGSYLEVIYNDGTIRIYSAENGELISKTVGEKPDSSQNEVFYTDLLRIEAPPNATPVAYDRQTGEFRRELEKDAYLSYVTQVGEYVITEYVTADGERYGLLLNEECETLARLPYLCDIIDDKLIFDYPSGNLRESHIYSIDELIELARE